MNYNDVKECPDISSYYHLQNKKYYESDTFDFDEKNTKIDDNLLYVSNGGTIEEECSVIVSNFSYNDTYFFLVIPFIWIMTGLCVIVFYCKYKRVKTEYNRLKEEIELSPTRSNIENHNDNSLQLEIN